MCLPLSLSPSRSHATDRGEDRPKIRGYETQRRANTRQRFARQKRDFLDPCLSIANPSLSCTLSFPAFPAICRIFEFSALLSLSLSLSSLSRIFLQILRDEREWTTCTRIRPRIVFDLLVRTYLVERAAKSELVSIGSIRAWKNASRKSRHSRRGRDKEPRIQFPRAEKLHFFPA